MLDCQGYSYLNNMAIHGFFKIFCWGESYLFIILVGENSSWLIVKSAFSVLKLPFLMLSNHTKFYGQSDEKNPKFASTLKRSTVASLSKSSSAACLGISGSGGIAQPMALYCWFYPLVNVYITMEHHHVQWVNPLFQWPWLQ